MATGTGEIEEKAYYESCDRFDRWARDLLKRERAAVVQLKRKNPIGSDLFILPPKSAPWNTLVEAGAALSADSVAVVLVSSSSAQPLERAALEHCAKPQAGPSPTMRPSRFLAGVLLCVLPCGVRPIPPPEPERCHVHTHGTALRETFVASRDGPAGNASARELCYARVMAMPATMCTRESTVRELCSHSYIFIGGLFHSGTGAIRTALAAAAPSRVSVHSNTHRIEDEGKYMQTVYVVNRNRDARLWHCAFLESKRDESQHPPHTPGALRKDEADALSLNPRGSALLFSQWARFWDTRMPILVEKSPMNLLAALAWAPPRVPMDLR
ncbi:hypothetical protein T492DRAFT_860649 [Pavlovales sp. CCMP2436]|nr:hypothetical protein T492DRAFT_860649 [Pavlovales sp. CCMP2436]